MAASVNVHLKDLTLRFSQISQSKMSICNILLGLFYYQLHWTLISFSSSINKSFIQLLYTAQSLTNYRNKYIHVWQLNAPTFQVCSQIFAFYVSFMSVPPLRVSTYLPSLVKKFSQQKQKLAYSHVLICHLFCCLFQSLIFSCIDISSLILFISVSNYLMYWHLIAFIV